tara:strand:- start:678 stop:1013 length:336 start_codon:yes stop_codon:yes gene_type:complete
MSYSLSEEAYEIADEAWQETKDRDAAIDFIHETCDGHELSIYYGKAIDFCAANDTTCGEDYLDDIGGISQKGDTFGAIACRLAYACLVTSALACLDGIIDEDEEEEELEDA